MSRHAATSIVAFVLVACLVAPASAGWFDKGVKGSGDLVTQTYDLEDCHRILLRTGLDITVTFGDRQEIALTVDDNLVELYEIDVQDGRLIIDADENPRPHRKTHLDVTLKTLDHLKISGAGDIEIIDVVGEDLELIIDGAGDLEVDGTVTNLEITVNGAGDVDARSLEAEHVVVTVNGAGDVAAYASESADLTINGVGDIDLYGKPDQFARSIHGIGDIDRK